MTADGPEYRGRKATDLVREGVSFEAVAELLWSGRLPAEPRKLLLLSTPMPQLPLDLRKEIPTIDLALPGLDDLRTVCQGVAGERGLTYEEDEQLLQAARGLTLTLHDIDEVEGLLYDLLAAGANRVDRVQFESSARSERRNEARVLAVRAARAKAEAMAAELGQTIGEPVRVEEQTPSGWQAPVMNNVALNNDSLAQVSETVAGGKLRVHAGVSVVFTLRPA